MTPTTESLFIEILTPRKKGIIIGVLYKPPNSDSNYFLEEYQTLMDQPIFNSKHCFLTGDLNIALINRNEHFTNDYPDLLLSNSFVPLIARPIRITDQSATLIDL